MSRLTSVPDLPALFDQMERFQNWLILHRKEEDGLYSHGNKEWFMDDPFVEQLRVEFPESASAPHNVRSVALNSMIALQCTACRRSREA